MKFKNIGIIHSPYDRKRINKPPTQGREDVESIIEVFKEYEDGLIGLKKGDKILVLYWADEADRDFLVSKGGHFIKKEERGVFSIRSPHRPNPILVSKCEILAIKDNVLQVNGLEALDESMLLDIKISVD
ncbi:MAG: tRNA (N6-threonylcarbamoyladenosine(37)-N6)-methyltransferase TrmO [Anaerococcus sp.]|nr:tRNA (N6-threonylcarbamoyladenosine(37)-N6)-methyltransferase TrmO [Anaerococcus sp.]